VIRRDRELLARLTKVNSRLGAVVIELLEHQDDDGLPAAGLRPLGEHLAALGADLLARADELDSVIDAEPDNTDQKTKNSQFSYSERPEISRGITVDAIGGSTIEAHDRHESRHHDV
jgi:hypothetical protein